MIYNVGGGVSSADKVKCTDGSGQESNVQTVLDNLDSKINVRYVPETDMVQIKDANGIWHNLTRGNLTWEWIISRALTADEEHNDRFYIYEVLALGAGGTGNGKGYLWTSDIKPTDSQASTGNGANAYVQFNFYKPTKITNIKFIVNKQANVVIYGIGRLGEQTLIKEITPSGIDTLQEVSLDNDSFYYSYKFNYKGVNAYLWNLRLYGIQCNDI